MEINTKNENNKFPEEISSKYEIIQEIGRGAFSIVYKVKSKEDNNIYCLKKINMKKTNDKENEIKILSNLDHPNLIKFFYSYSNEEGIYIIMEFCEYGDLFSLLQSVKKKKVYVNEEIIWNVAIQTLLGLEYLHSKQIIHRDIKLLNLFMTKDKKIKIGDMGMSKHVEEGEMIMSRVGTPLYIAPELVKKEKYDYKIDIWSFGCSLYHLAKTSPPFNDENLIKLGNSIINEEPMHLPSCYSQKLYEFILVLMTKNKNKRPSATEALKLIPEQIKDKLEGKTKEKNKDNFYKNNNNNNNKNRRKTIDEDSLSNKNINESKNDINNNNDSKILLSNKLIVVKNNENLNDNLNINKGLVSGQTFYKFFKNNPDRKKSNKYFGINNSEINNNNNNINNILLEPNNNNINNNNINNNNNNKNNNLLLSKTMLHIKYHFNRIRTPGNINNEKNSNNEINNKEIKNNVNNIKIISQSYGKLNIKNNIQKYEKQMKKIEEEKKEEYNINDESNFVIKENMDKKNKKINQDLPISRNKLEKNNFPNKSENERFNLQPIDKSIESTPNRKIGLKYNRKEIVDKYFNIEKLNEKGGEYNYDSRDINNALKTFLNKDHKNNNRDIIYSMQFNNKKIRINKPIKMFNFNKDIIYNNDNNKEELIFPLIQPDKRINKSKKNSQNNSISEKTKKHPEFYKNFRKTVNSNNFRNKLTIHDLK